MASAILTFHSLDDSGSLISTDRGLFRRQIEWLASHRIQVAPLDQVVSEQPSVALTFDDGYENFAEVALPILMEFRMPATVFVVSGSCGKQNDWTPGSIPRLRLMDWATLQDLPADLISLGSHSVSHRDLTQLPPSQIHAELHDSRLEIEDRTSRPVRLFAYPYGRSAEAVRAVARRGYSLAVGTRLSYLPLHPDSHNLPRIDAYYLRRAVWFSRVAAGKGRAYLGLRGMFRSMRERLG